MRLLFVALTSAALAAPPEAILDEKHRAFFKDHCLGCHNAEKQKGKLRLDDIPFRVDTLEKADLWQKVLNSMNSGEMPPEDEKQPDPSVKTDFLDDLSRMLVTARAALSDSGGILTMRRLNRREYRNTIRDLLGVDLRVNELPPDGGAGAFDTVGASLFMSSNQFEQYLALGRQALDEHFARFVAPAPAKPRLLRVEAEEKNARIAKALARRVDAHQRYEQWTAAVDAAARASGNTDLAARITAEKPHTPTHLYTQWQRIPGAPAPANFGFADSVEAEHQGHADWNHYVPHHRAYVEHPLTRTGAFLTVEDASVNPYQAFRIPGDWPAGEYVVRVRIGATGDTPASRHFVEFGSQHDSGVRAIMSSHQVTGTLAEPQVLEIPLRFAPANGHGFFLQEKGSYASEKTAREVFNEAKARNGIGPEFALWIDWVEVAGGGGAGKPADAPKPRKLRKDPEQWANKYMPIYAQGYAEKFNRFQKWCAAIDDAAGLPGNADTLRKLREEPKVRQSPHLFYSRFAEIAGAPAPVQFGFRDVDDAQFARSEYQYHFRYYDDYVKLPARETGSWLMLYSLGRFTGIAAPSDWPPGKYTLRVRLAASDESPPERRFIEIGTGKADAADFNVLSSHQVTGTLAQPQTLEIPVEINANGERNFAIRDKRPNTRAAEYAMFREAWDKTGTGPRPCIWVDFVELENAGPADAHPDASLPPVLAAGETDARKALESFAERAFRGRKPSAAFVDKLVFLHETRRRAGESFEKAIREPLSVILASPGFLYLQEIGSQPLTRHALPDEEGGRVRALGKERERFLTQPEMASRLSYFLWSAPPDQVLLNADLAKPGDRALQVERMIASPKADAFVSGFVHQWLGMDRLDFFQFDSKQFRDFDESAKAAARREVYETFAHLLRSGGSLKRLLKSDEVHVNGLLANYYGIEGITGDVFQKVKLPADSPRGGLLGMAAILAMGSNGERTSPVERGAWVLRKLLHNPPPPAPPNVPQLTRLENKPLSTRERLLAHQEEPQCLQCHRKIDPIGLGLENFNAAGKWREEETYDKRGAGTKTWPIDAGGQFYKGPAFQDYFQLRDLIAERSVDFARGFAEALIEYALGRPYGFMDAPLVEGILERAEARDLEIREFLVALVTSGEFGRK